MKNYELFIAKYKGSMMIDKFNNGLRGNLCILLPQSFYFLLSFKENFPISSKNVVA